MSDILVGTDRQQIINIISKSNRPEGNVWYENRNRTGKEALKEPCPAPRFSLVQMQSSLKCTAADATAHEAQTC